MAKKQDTKKTKDEKPKAAKAPAKEKNAKAASKSASAEAPTRKSGKGKLKPEATTAVLRSLAAPIARASAGTGSKTRKVAKSAAVGAKALVPEVPKPNLPQVGGGHDVMQTAKEIGGQIMGVLNTDAGRVIAAEVLIYLAKSLTRAASNTEAGKDATETMLNAGARIGAAVAGAGARAMENGGSLADAGAEVAATAATSASDVAREVAQVAVSTVGSVVADAASKVIRRRSPRAKTPESGSEGGEGSGSSPALGAGASTAA